MADILCTVGVYPADSRGVTTSIPGNHHDERCSNKSEAAFMLEIRGGPYARDAGAGRDAGLWRNSVVKR